MVRVLLAVVLVAILSQATQAVTPQQTVAERRAADEARKDVRRQAARDYRNAYLAQRQAEYAALAQRQQRLADIYVESNVAAQGAAAAQLQVNQQTLLYEAQLRSVYPTTVVVRPDYGNYWGIYAPGVYPRGW